MNRRAFDLFHLSNSRDSNLTWETSHGGIGAVWGESAFASGQLPAKRLKGDNDHCVRNVAAFEVGGEPPSGEVQHIGFEAQRSGELLNQKRSWRPAGAVFKFNQIWSRDCAAVFKSNPHRNLTLRQTEFPAPPFDDLSKVFHFTATSLVTLEYCNSII
jgi:hypothetical protein